MKSFKVVYRYGHFIDIESKKRIIPVQEELYTITANDNSFKTEDDILVNSKPENREKKQLWMEQKYGKGNFHKILDANSALYFKIGNNKKREGYESPEYIFSCFLLEDLYLHKKATGNGENLEDWRLTDCKCYLQECIYGNLIISDKIPAESLSSLFGITVMFYFNMQRSSSCNAFKTFFQHFNPRAKQLHKSLEELRKDFVIELNNKD